MPNRGCEHQFIWIEQVFRSSAPKLSSRMDRCGARVGCARCGHIRIVWDNGELEIKENHGGESNS